MAKNRLLLDIMLDDKFVCQLTYTKRGFPEMIDGRIVETYDSDDIKKFVEEMRPSLKGTGYTIEFSNNQIFK